ncbi:MAG TPA: HDOD domain-containing protein, partial [Spirochaetota bacterium]|nr:HDOD domain-containing protein [Spirochaetota bacterium]HQH98595.1 HDOD domain-containing protein [Spirochaetota bacterium]
PEYLIEAINHHHAPYNSTPKFHDIVNVIYLANMMAGIEDRRYSYYYIDESILEKYNLLDVNKFTELHNRLKGRFEPAKNT